MKVTVRRLAIAAAGVATLIVVLSGSRESAKTLARTTPLEETRGALAPHERRGKPVIDGLPGRQGLEPQRANLFAADALQPVVSPRLPEAQPPPAPVPPPNPYRFAGALLYEGKFRTFITDGDRVYEVHAGEELTAQYRVDSVTKDEVVLVYTPLGTKHPMAAKWAFSPDATVPLTGTVTVVMGGPTLPLPPGSPLVAAVNEPTFAAPLPPGSPLSSPVAAR